MLIISLLLYTSDLDAQKHFYQEILGVELKESHEDHFTLQIGSSQLIFKKVEQSEQSYYYHFAINIPSYQIKEAQQWISKKTKILPFHGNEIVDFKSWNAEALYFYDPAGNIVEFIARKNLNIVTDKPFTSQSFQHISEIGLPVTDVQKTFDLLNKGCGLLKFSGDYERFCAIGSETGLFITIDYKQKDWIPNGDPAFPLPFQSIVENNNLRFRISYDREKIIIA